MKLVILDLENTLCDVAAAEAKARARINIILRAADLPVDEFWCQHSKIERTLLENLVSGFLPRSDYLWRRFADPCTAFGATAGVLPEVIEEIFSEEITQRIKLFDEVPETLFALQNHGFELAILASGDSQSQRSRYKNLGLGDYVKANRFFVDEEIGFLKPAPELFMKIVADCGVSPSEACMVGDSIRDDVWSAELAGLKGILLDRSPSTHYTGERIASLSALLPLLVPEIVLETTQEVVATPQQREPEMYSFVL